MGNDPSKSSPLESNAYGRSVRNQSVSSRLARGVGRSKNSAIEPPPTIKIGASSSCNDNLLTVNSGGDVSLQQQDGSDGSKLSIDASRSRSGSASSNAGSVGNAGNKQAKKTSISLRNRQLIQSCFQNPHESLGKRILKRAAEKRREIAKFYLGLSSEHKDEVEETIKQFLKKCVASIDQADEMQKLAEEMGARFVQFRAISFKVDYFSAIADSTITECAFLDNAIHPAHQTLSAFSQFITTLFTSVRDGFYNEMRRLRRTSNSFSTGSNGSNHHKGGAKKLSIDSTARSRDASPRSLSPGGESTHHSSSGGEENSSPASSSSKRPSNSASLVIPSNFDEDDDCADNDAQEVGEKEEFGAGKFKSAELIIVPSSPNNRSCSTNEITLYAKPNGKCHGASNNAQQSSSIAH